MNCILFASMDFSYYAVTDALTPGVEQRAGVLALTPHHGGRGGDEVLRHPLLHPGGRHGDPRPTGAGGRPPLSRLQVQALRLW